MTVNTQAPARLVSQIALAIIAIAGLILATFVAVTPASATITVTLHQGNPTCATLGTQYDHEFKVEPVTAGLKDDPNSDFQVTLTLVSTANGPTVNFSANLPVDAVFVKGGPGGNLYAYSPAVTSGSGLHAPGNDKGTAVSTPPWSGLSHLSFCFNDVPQATPTPTPDISTPTPTPEGGEINLLTEPCGPNETPRVRVIAALLLGLHLFLDDGSGFDEFLLDGAGEAEVAPGTYDWEIRNGDDEVLAFGEITVAPCTTGVTPSPTPGTPTPTPEGTAAGGTGTPAGSPAGSVPDTATSLGGFGGPVATMVFGLILLGSLGALAYANVAAVRRRS